MELFRFDYTISEEDYIKFNLYYMLHDANTKKSLTMMQWLVPAIVIVVGLLLVRDTAIWIFYGILCALWIAFSKKLMLKSAVRNIRKMGKKGTLPYSSKGTVIFTENSVTDKGNRATTEIEYAQIEKVCFFEDYIYVFFSSVGAVIINLASIPETDRAKPEEILRGKVSAEKLLRD